MLESMITHPVATPPRQRVANAVWDGTDAVMLWPKRRSASTRLRRCGRLTASSRGRARGRYAPRGRPSTRARLEDKDTLRLRDARAAYALAVDTRGDLVDFTKTGSAVRRVAKYRPTPPIIAVADSEEVARRLGLVWGVYSIVVPVERDPDEVFRKAGQMIIDEGMAEQGEYALLVGSLPMTEEAGRTNLVHFRPLGT